MKKNVDKGIRSFAKIAFYASFLISTLTVFSQTNEVEVRSVNTDNFPVVKGKLWVRNPDGIDTRTIQFIENSKVVPEFENSQPVDSIVSNKVILFLVRNTASSAEMSWYKEVISNAFKDGVIHSGDEIEIVGFSCIIGKQILFPNKLDFTDDQEELLKRIDNIQNYRRIENRGRVQTDLAINEALTILGNINIKLPKGLFVFSDDLSMNSQLVGELPGARSHKLNIPIYGVTYYKPNTGYSIEQLCSQTYGSFVSTSTNDKKYISKKLVSFLNEFESRHAGHYYPFSYTSTFEKDGQAHFVKVVTKEGTTGFSLAVPSKSFLEMIQDNLLVSLIIFILLIGLTIVIILFVKKNKLKKQELELEREKQLAELKIKQQSANDKLSQQESEMQRLQAEERSKREQEEQAKRVKAQEEDDDRQIRKMMERGNLPWFEYKFGDMSGSYQIQYPKITVGRDNDNTWVISHPTVSRHHFELTFKDYVYTIRDLGSSNGLFVNDYKTTEVELKHGDCIQIGEIILTFHI